MHGTILCPVRCPIGKPTSDAVIRGWLATIGWRAPTYVKNGVMWVTGEARAEYLNSLVAEKWVGNSRPPTVGFPLEAGNE